MRLIDHYSPSDYQDCFERDFLIEKPMSPDYLFDSMFCTFPKSVTFLLKLRDIMVKPFGLEGGISFQNLIIERNSEEIVLGKCDRHLNFWVILYCSKVENIKQKSSVTTIVKFNNLFGRVYFSIIWIFHKILVYNSFNRSVKAYLKSDKFGKCKDEPYRSKAKPAEGAE